MKEDYLCDSRPSPKFKSALSTIIYRTSRSNNLIEWRSAVQPFEYHWILFNLDLREKGREREREISKELPYERMSSAILSDHRWPATFRSMHGSRLSRGRNLCVTRYLGALIMHVIVSPFDGEGEGENHKFNSLRCAEEASCFGMKTRIELWKSILKPCRSLVLFFSCPSPLALCPKFVDDVIYVNKSNLCVTLACTRAVRARILEESTTLINDTHLIKLAAKRFAIRWESLSRWK